MPTSVIPYIPETIVVHLGAPRQMSPFPSPTMSKTSSPAKSTPPGSPRRWRQTRWRSFPSPSTATIPSITAAAATILTSRPPLPSTRSTSKGGTSMKTSPSSSMKSSTGICGARALSSRWRQSSATGSRPRARVSASGAHSILPRAARTLFRFCARTTAILSWSQTRPSRSRHRPTPAHPCAGAIQMPT